MLSSHPSIMNNIRSICMVKICGRVSFDKDKRRLSQNSVQIFGQESRREADAQTTDTRGSTKATTAADFLPPEDRSAMNFTYRQWNITVCLLCLHWFFCFLCFKCRLWKFGDRWKQKSIIADFLPPEDRTAMNFTYQHALEHYRMFALFTFF